MERKICFIVNRETIDTQLSPGITTLDFIRQHLKLPGTKEGCREGECGACTVLLGEMSNGKIVYRAVASCLLPLGELQGKHVVTVEGINKDIQGAKRDLTPIQQALTDEGASQCGFCTPGIVMSLTGFFLNATERSFEEAIDSLDGNICRCTGYAPIYRAAKKLYDSYADDLKKKKVCLPQLVEWGILPHYFLDIPERLLQINEASTETQGSIPSSSPVIVAGATDLLVQQQEQLAEKELYFISNLKPLKGISCEEGFVSIGAGVTVEEMKVSPIITDLFPKMAEYLNLVSSTIMRNRATLAGNLVNASPIGDLSIILLALQAVLVLNKEGEKRQVALKEFFKGYKEMDLEAGEIIERIVFPVPAEGMEFHFEKVSQRRYLDIASCNSAMSIQTDGDTIRDIHLSAGGVAPVPLFLTRTCDFLRGKEINGTILTEAADILKKEISPISDVRGSVTYKSLLLRNLLFAHFIDLFPDKHLQKAFQEVAT